MHFTDDIIQVPDNYRATVKRMDLPEHDGPARKEGNSTAAKKEDNYKDRLGRGEKFWKDRVDEWRKKLKVLEERNENLRSRYNELTERINSTRGSTERTTLRKEREQIKGELDQSRAEIEEARTMLEKKIPEESEIYKAKPEWLRP